MYPDGVPRSDRYYDTGLAQIEQPSDWSAELEESDDDGEPMPPPPRLAQISRKYDRNAHGTYRDGRGFGHYYDRDGNLVMVNPRLAQIDQPEVKPEPEESEDEILAQISSKWSREGSGVYRDGRGFGHYRDPKTGNLVISSPWQTRRRSLAQTNESACDIDPMSWDCSMEYLYGPDGLFSLAQTTESPCDSNPMSWECAMEYMHGLAQIEAEESGDLNDCSDMCD